MSTNNKSREHQANERTFLAWVRTSVGIIALGFVIARFDAQAKTSFIGIFQNSFLGIGVVLLGIVISVIAYLNYIKVRRELAYGRFNSSQGLPAFLVIIMCLIATLVITYIFLN